MADEGKETREWKPFLYAKKPNPKYPLIDNDPHFNRVIGYARPTDYLWGAAVGAVSPGLMLFWEHMSPSGVSRAGFRSVFRLSLAIGATAGFIFFYNSSALRFYGMYENSREVEMDMREMVDKVKKGEPLYGVTQLSDYMQGVASRNSRYSGLMLHMVPMFNFVNHNQHGVDTAKYYQQAERELEAEKLAKGVSWKDGKVDKR